MAHENQRRADPKVKKERVALARKARTGYTLAEYDAFVEQQEGRCAICRQPPNPRKALAADHCHRTGAKRGLLCDSCNIGLGFFFDDPYRLHMALEYLGGL